MPRVKQEELEKVTLNLTAGDRETLGRFFPAVGWSVAARKIINRTCRRLEENESQSSNGGGSFDISIGNIESDDD